MTEVFDVSMPVRPGMLGWPTGRPAARHEVVDDAGPRNSEWHLDSHAGTHIDAPLHWLEGGRDVGGIPLEACLGPCLVAQADGETIEVSDVPDAEALAAAPRVLFRTRNSRLVRAGAEFDPRFVALGEAAARRLVSAGVSLVGVDYLSVESPSGDGSVHRVLLEAGVVLLEGLVLAAVEPGRYNISALPVHWVGGEASPTRAVLWR